MIIKSVYGFFSIVISEKDQDQLLVRSNSKKDLMKIFDEKRINESNGEGCNFYVGLCKQEFAHTLIMMIKDINYHDFDQFLSETDISPNEVLA